MYVCAFMENLFNSSEFEQLYIKNLKIKGKGVYFRWFNDKLTLQAEPPECETEVDEQPGGACSSPFQIPTQSHPPIPIPTQGRIQGTS